MDALSMKDCDLILSGHKAPDSRQGEASSKSGLSGLFVVRAWHGASTRPQSSSTGSATLFALLDGSAAS